MRRYAVIRVESRNVLRKLPGQYTGQWNVYFVKSRLNTKELIERFGRLTATFTERDGWKRLDKDGKPQPASYPDSLQYESLSVFKEEDDHPAA